MSMRLIIHILLLALSGVGTYALPNATDNVCNISLSITSKLVLDSVAYSRTIEGKFNKTSSDAMLFYLNAGTKSKYCPDDGIVPVTYTLKYCNQDKFPFQFDTTTECPLGGNGYQGTACNFAAVSNYSAVPGLSFTDLPAGQCRTITNVTTQDICATNPTTQDGWKYTAQIQIQGKLNGAFCRGYAFLKVKYQAIEPPIPTSKPVSAPVVKPSAPVPNTIKPAPAPVVKPAAPTVAPANVCNVVVGITSVMKLGTNVYNTSIEGKFSKELRHVYNVGNKGLYCPGNGDQPVTYTLKYCNKEQYALKFQKGTCSPGGPNGITDCNYAWVNDAAVLPKPDFTTDLAPGECRYITNVTIHNICLPFSSSLVSTQSLYPAQIQVQGSVNGAFCRGYAFLNITYDGFEPPLTAPPTIKPAPAPVVKPSAPTRAPANVCNFMVSISTAMKLETNVYNTTIQGKFPRADPSPQLIFLNATRAKYCDANGNIPVSYSFKYCNLEPYPLTFQTGTCEPGGPGGITDCNFIAVNSSRLYPDFTTNLAPNECRIAAFTTKHNICLLNTIYSGQIQIQGYVNSNVFCRAYGYLNQMYQFVDPPLQSQPPSSKPSAKPSQRKPTSTPATKPTMKPTKKPVVPTFKPTKKPVAPTSKPTKKPVTDPSAKPTKKPVAPTSKPTKKPVANPSVKPSKQPVAQPTLKPVANPSVKPSKKPVAPTSKPTKKPVANPSVKPSKQPVAQPTLKPVANPSVKPSKQPVAQPTLKPVANPSVKPSKKPVAQPTLKPTKTANPTSLPSASPSNNVCDIRVGIMSNLVFNSTLYYASMEGKFNVSNIKLVQLNATRSQICSPDNVQSVTYTFTYCNMGIFSYKFKTGTCDPSAVNGITACSFAAINGDSVDPTPDFTTDLAPGDCRSHTNVTKQDLCSSMLYSAEIYMQGSVNGMSCNGYGMMGLSYEFRDPISPSSAPTGTVAPSKCHKSKSKATRSDKKSKISSKSGKSSELKSIRSSKCTTSAPAPMGKSSKVPSKSGGSEKASSKSGSSSKVPSSDSNSFKLSPSIKSGGYNASASIKSGGSSASASIKSGN